LNPPPHPKKNIPGYATAYHRLFANHVHTIKAVCLKEVTDLKMSVRIPEIADYDDDFFSKTSNTYQSAELIKYISG
jgi:hypothetical protein